MTRCTPLPLAVVSRVDAGRVGPGSVTVRAAGHSRCCTSRHSLIGTPFTRQGHAYLRAMRRNGPGGAGVLERDADFFSARAGTHHLSNAGKHGTRDIREARTPARYTASGKMQDALEDEPFQCVCEFYYSHLTTV